MIDLDAIRTVLVKGLKEYLKIPVIRSNQTGNPPPYPYLSYTITNLASENRGTWGEYEDGKDRKPITQTWSLTVQSDNANEAMQLTMKAHEWLDRAGTVYLYDNHVIVQSVGNISNRDNLITIEHEYRNGFDFVLWLLSESGEEKVGSSTIENVELQSSNIPYQYDSDDYWNEKLEMRLDGEHEKLKTLSISGKEDSSGDDLLQSRLEGEL